MFIFSRTRFVYNLWRTFTIVLLWCSMSLPSSGQSEDPDDLKLWYNQPASNWNEALPVGNGRLGAMIFGGIASERLQLNEESVWTGKPTDFVNPEARKALPAVRKLLFEGKYAEAQKLAQEKMMGNKTVPSSYQTLGDLQLEFHNVNIATAYVRELDLETAIAKVQYKSGKAVHTREIFSSAPDQVMVVRLTSGAKGALDVTLKLNRPGNKATVEAQKGEIVMREQVGDAAGVKMVTRLKVLPEGGQLNSNGKELTIKEADAVTILVTAATDYWGKDPEAQTAQQLAAAEKRSYEALRADHIKDYQSFFKRVDVDFGKTDAVYFPTDTRLAAMQKGNVDPHLVEVYYQYGRYLLISSSRPGGLPANLQGIWADGLNPPWDADYHININIQMNYWPAETTNLSELHLPFITFLNAMRTDARKTARDMYGVKGAVGHFTTDAWHFTEPYGKTQWAMWPMGMAWSAQHAWEHYAFTGDLSFLKTLGYPLMRDAAEFCLNWLVEHPETKQLVSGPSISPENTFRTKDGKVATMVMGPTMDHMIIRNLFNNTIEAGEILNTDAAFRKKMEKALARLAPTKIGSDGRIMEWTEEFEEPEPGHRHISHLFGLHPGDEITRQKNPELMEAARKTIAYRLANGGGHTGWSRAWIINFFARLHDRDAAYDNVLALLRKSTLPNLFDTHPPFQIDGNFGATAGITEMMLQSHTEEIELLPALPAAWSMGHLHGVCARGGFELDIDWEQGQLKKVTILSKLGNLCKVRYKDKVGSFPTEKGKRYVLDGDLQLE